MPYIKKLHREVIIQTLPNYGEVVDFQSITTAGELNFAITYIIQHYLLSKGLEYQHINDVMGALEGAKLEFYRRIAIPYEEAKIKVNGDVMQDELKTKGKV